MIDNTQELDLAGLPLELDADEVPLLDFAGAALPPSDLLEPELDFESLLPESDFEEEESEEEDDEALLSALAASL